MENLADIASLIAAVTGVIGVIFLFIEWMNRLKWKATYLIHDRDDGKQNITFKIYRYGKKEAILKTDASNANDKNECRSVPVFKSRYLPDKKLLGSLTIQSNPAPEQRPLWDLKPKDNANEESLISATQANKIVWLKVYYQDFSISQKIYEKWIKAEPKQ